MNKVNHLLFFDDISPLHTKLLGLIASVNVVEDGKLGSNEPGKVSCLDVSQIEGKKELVMPDHVSDPFVVRPST